MARFCETCDDQIDGDSFAMGHYEDLCEDCYDSCQQNCFECDECGMAVPNEDLVEDVSYGPYEHSTCYSCFVDVVIDTLPSPLCECGKPCPKKTQIELVVQLEKKTELYEPHHPTKYSFHQDCCKGCGFAALLATRTVTYDNQRVGFLMRLKLGNDPSALINRFLGGTAVSKLVKPNLADYLKRMVRRLNISSQPDNEEEFRYRGITDLSCYTARYEMRARYPISQSANPQIRRAYELAALVPEELFAARLALLDE